MSADEMGFEGWVFEFEAVAWSLFPFARLTSSLVRLLSGRGRCGDGGGDVVKTDSDSLGPRLEGREEASLETAGRCWGEGVRVRKPEREPSVLERPWRMTELRHETMRSEGVLWEDSFPIEEAMLRRAELERLRIRREMVELASQFS